MCILAKMVGKTAEAVLLIIKTSCFDINLLMVMFRSMISEGKNQFFNSHLINNLFRDLCFVFIYLGIMIYSKVYLKIINTHFL